MSKSISSQKYLIVAITLCLLLYPLLILIFSHGNIETEQSLCPFKMLTGFPCPGCGITKSLYFLYQGDWSKSLHYHLFGPLLLLAFIGMLLILMFEFMSGKTIINRLLYNKKVTLILGVGLMIYHFTRLVIFVSENKVDDILRQSIWK